MASVFPPWSNTALRLALIAVLMGGIGAVAAPMIYVRTSWQRGQLEAVDQPVQFDHRHHVQDDGVNCLYCHSSADRSPYAGVPATETCMGCHGQVWNQSPMLEVVRRSYFSGTPIAWNRVHAVPGFVYFNHAAHVNKGVGCVSCHGRVDQMAAVYQVAPLTMAWCLDCHRDPVPNLRPLSAVTDTRWDPGAQRDEIGQAVASALDVQRLTHCTTCHR